MNFDDVDAALARLTVHDEAPEPAARTRRQCLSQIEKGRNAGLARQRFDWLEPAAAIGLSGLYLAAAVQLSVAFLRTFG
jgi:hypothetical protein